MIIEKFCVKNYKSIKNSGFVKLEEDMTLLIGKNEAGKTSILKALESFKTDYEYDEDDLSLHSDDKEKYDKGELFAEDIPIINIHFKIEIEDLTELIDINPEFEDITGLIATKYFDDHYKIEILDLNREYNGFTSEDTYNQKIESYKSELSHLTDLFRAELNSVISNAPYTSFKEDFEIILNKILGFDDFNNIDHLNYHNELKKILDDPTIESQVNKYITDVEDYKKKITWNRMKL